MRAVFLRAGVGFVLSIPHWEYKRIKTTKKKNIKFRLVVLRRPYTIQGGLVSSKTHFY
jgi:hypothetical protein